MEWSWYGVKTLYRMIALGNPKATDKHYDPESTMVEERVVLIRARSFREAIEKAEKDAKRYARETNYRNPYGQRIKQRYLGMCDAFECYDEPRAGVEVYSSTEIVGKDISDKYIGDSKLGAESTKMPDPRRKKFFNREFSGALEKGA